MPKSLFVYCCILLFPLLGLGQDTTAPKLEADTQNVQIVNDTTAIQNPKKHSPTKASIFSTIVPGLGQIYNKKYWKLPIIYGGIGYTLYKALDQRTQYVRLKEAYLSRFNDNPGDDLLTDQYSTADAINFDLEQAYSSMERFYIFAGLIYILNIVDASVDAHLYHFDVSNDLSLQLIPLSPINTPINQGFNLSLATLKITF